MKFKQFRNIELGRLQDFSLADVDVLQGVDAPRRLLDLPTNSLGHELLHQLLQVATCRLTGDNLEHLLPDLPHLTRLRVCGLPHLRGAAFCEADSEKTEEVAIGGFDVNVGFNECLPLANKGTELVGGKVHAMEVGKAVLALNFINAQLDFAEGLLLILVKVSQRNLNNTASERVIGILCKCPIN